MKNKKTDAIDNGGLATGDLRHATRNLKRTPTADRRPQTIEDWQPTTDDGRWTTDIE